MQLLAGAIPIARGTVVNSELRVKLNARNYCLHFARIRLLLHLVHFLQGVYPENPLLQNGGGALFALQ